MQQRCFPMAYGFLCTFLHAAKAVCKLHTQAAVSLSRCRGEVLSKALDHCVKTSQSNCEDNEFESLCSHGSRLFQVTIVTASCQLNLEVLVKGSSLPMTFILLFGSFGRLAWSLNEAFLPQAEASTSVATLPNWAARCILSGAIWNKAGP